MAALCLHCKRPLLLLQKLADAKFCSPGHRRDWQESVQHRMIERLAESEEALRMASQRRRSESARHLMPARAGFMPMMPEPVLPDLPIATGVRTAWKPAALVVPGIPELPHLLSESPESSTARVPVQTSVEPLQLAC